MQDVHEMRFEEFLSAASPTASVNRWPTIANGKEVVTYSVYLNGAVSEAIAQDLQQQDYQDVKLHALTEKLGLDPSSFRNNLGVAELVAARHAYMSAVLDAATNRLARLTPEVEDDFALLTDGMKHPSIAERLVELKRLEISAGQVKGQAETALGPVEEVAPGGVLRGRIVAQNADFSVQSVGDGKVATHQNSRLVVVPQVGDDITVTYYRGSAQVIDHARTGQYDQPYISEQTHDLAMNYVGDDGVRGTVLFESVAAFADFANLNGWPQQVVEKAVALRAEHPKPVRQVVPREPVGVPFIDEESRAIGLRFKQGRTQYTALFHGEAFSKLAPHYGADEAMVAHVGLLNKRLNSGVAHDVTRSSLLEADSAARAAGLRGLVADPTESRHSGTVVAETPLHIVQDVGRGQAVIHDKRLLEHVPAVGQRLDVTYRNGRGALRAKENEGRGVSR